MPAKSKLGQNFLHDQTAIRRIVSALGDCSQLTVVEIGPGRAAVTRVLLPAAARVVAIEVDSELVSRLRSEFPADKLTVVLLSDNSQRVYAIDGYDYDEAVITVTWERGDEQLITEFGEFSADHRAMVQLENDVGQRREFRRCS